MFSKIKSHIKKGSLFPVVLNVMKRPFKKFSARFEILKKDLSNKVKYGKHAPLHCERIWINPLEIDEIVFNDQIKNASGTTKYKASGIVIDWDDIESTSPLDEQFRIKYCNEHWSEGKSWEEIGVINYMTDTRKYGSWPREKIVKRFNKLDQLYEETKKHRRLKTREEIDPNAFRENEGILIHIGPNGKPFFGGGGFHRLAIARILKLEEIPACIGVVDRDSIPHLKHYRKS